MAKRIGYDFSAFTGNGAAIKDILSQNMESRLRYTGKELQAAGLKDSFTHKIAAIYNLSAREFMWLFLGKEWHFAGVGVDHWA
ncbi:hypothetical protein [Desulfotruncus alcoholivorax]|uniref:hypothetical protein n=1 Tax=Desulfotruncus alcoholivorax TaxID=265477 RepID=UPI0003FD8D4B|nr:hypothetical protein [Desulfotruncus alcoholivorax]